jgi:hypothetical protein
MIALVYLAHILGFALWMGGGFASGVIGKRALVEERTHIDTLVRTLNSLQTRIMLPGVLLTLLSGIYLSMPRMQTGALTAWLMLMQGCGILAALVFFFVVRPTTSRLTTLSAVGENAGRFDALRKRAAMGGMLAAILGLLALVGGVMHKYLILP